MSRAVLAAVALLAASLAFAAPSPRPVRGAPARAELERLKSLVGDYDADIDADGKPDATVTYRTTAEGSAVVETLFAGTSHEMLTVYHMNGDELWLTHYCAAGNQPRMRLVSAGSPMTFHFVDATNLSSRDDLHMGHVQITILDDTHLKSEWTSYKQRKPDFVAKFDLKQR